MTSLRYVLSVILVLKTTETQPPWRAFWCRICWMPEITDSTWLSDVMKTWWLTILKGWGLFMSFICSSLVANIRACKDIVPTLVIENYGKFHPESSTLEFRMNLNKARVDWLIDWLAVSLRRVGSTGHIHVENIFLNFYSSIPFTQNAKVHNQFVSVDAYEFEKLIYIICGQGK